MYGAQGSEGQDWHIGISPRATRCEHEDMGKEFGCCHELHLGALDPPFDVYNNNLNYNLASYFSSQCELLFLYFERLSNFFKLFTLGDIKRFLPFQKNGIITKL